MTAMKRVVVVGASGMVGGYALRYLLEDPALSHERKYRSWHSVEV